MDGKIKVMTVFGTRPEAIKMAPVVLELAKREEFVPIVAVTAQHREMLDQVLNLFKITPDYDLDIMQNGQTLFDITKRSLAGLDEVISTAKPDLVLVHGDTTTTFTGALASYYHQIQVGHVEAGLRTHNIYSPFPEEMNRKLTGAIANLHFAPTATSRENLLRENIDPKSIFVTGNTVIDALHHTVKDNYAFEGELRNIDFRGKKIILVTTHRRENLGEPMRQVYKALRKIVDEHNSVEILFPVHRNPKVREVVEAELGGLSAVHLVEPLDYEPFANVIAQSHLILTDSGGVQEEAPAIGKPVLVLRDTTERPEAVAAGTVRLIGTEEEIVYQNTLELITDTAAYDKMAKAKSPYGDGKAAKRICDAILYAFGKTTSRPESFSEQ